MAWLGCRIEGGNFLLLMRGGIFLAIFLFRIIFFDNLFTYLSRVFRLLASFMSFGEKQILDFREEGKEEVG